MNRTDLVKQEADAIVADYPGKNPLELASELDRKADVYDQGPEMARAVAAELRRRGLSVVGQTTVQTLRLSIHDRNAEGVITIELIGEDGYSRAFFVDADQGLAEMAAALARDDYEDRAPDAF